MRIIIVGGGKIGYHLAKMLKETDHDISVVEKDHPRSRVLANQLDVKVIWGNGTMHSVLEQAGVKTCNALIAVAGQDEDNLICCQLAKKLYNVPKTIAKANNPKNVESMKDFGIDFVLSETDNIIASLEREVDNSRIKELISLNGGKSSVVEVSLPDDFAYSHRQLIDIVLPESCNIVSITRGDDFLIPRGKTKLISGDKLLIVVATGAEKEVRKALKLKK